MFYCENAEFGCKYSGNSSLEVALHLKSSCKYNYNDLNDGIEKERRKEDEKEEIVLVFDMKALLSQISNVDLELQYQALMALHQRLLSADNNNNSNNNNKSKKNNKKIPTIDEMMNSTAEIIPNLSNFLKTDGNNNNNNSNTNTIVKKIQLETIDVLTIIVSSQNRGYLQIIVDSGVLSNLVQLLVLVHCQWMSVSSNNNSNNNNNGDDVTGQVEETVYDSDELLEKILLLLGNIALFNHSIARIPIITSGAFKAVLDILISAVDKSNNSRGKPKILKKAIFAFCNFCKAKYFVSNYHNDGESDDNHSMIARSFPYLAKLLYASDENVLEYTCTTIFHLTDYDSMNGQHYVSSENISALLRQGIARRLTELLLYHQPSVSLSALKVVGNIVTGDDLQTQVMINASVLPCLHHLLLKTSSSEKKHVRKEVCWVLSNILAGCTVQIQAVIDAEIIPALIDVITTSSSSDVEVIKEAIFGIANGISGGTKDQIKYMVNNGCIKAFCSAISHPLNFIGHPNVISVVLEALNNILLIDGYNDVNGSENKIITLFKQAGGIEILKHLQQSKSAEVAQRANEMIENYQFSTNEPE